MATATKKRTKVAPFAVEATPPRNGNLMLRSIPGRIVLRGAFSSSATVTVTNEDGEEEEVVPLDQARDSARVPRIRGEIIAVHPTKRQYKTKDPLRGDKRKLNAIRNAVNDRRAFSMKENMDGVPPRSGEISVHEMKTLIREILDFHDDGQVKVVSGKLPTREQVDNMPGEYLLNAGMVTRTSQPRFEKDLPEWEAKLNAAGA